MSLPLLLLGSAIAADTGRSSLSDGPHADTVAAPVHGELDLTVGSEVVVPRGQSGTATVVTLGLSTALSARHRLGLRVGVVPRGRGARWPVWAPAVDYRVFLRRGGPLDPFLAAQLGFLLADRRASRRVNLAALAGAVGLGFEKAWLVGRRSVYVAPSMGIAPGAFFGDGPFSVAAPMAGVRCGVRMR